jgi:flagellar hook assembly protein FlgD
VAGPELPPAAYKLDGAYPNPFNPAARIRFELPESVQTRITIYDLKGQQVRALLDEVRPAGRHEVIWNGRDDGGAAAASGTYLLRLKAGAYAANSKLTLLK